VFVLVSIALYPSVSLASLAVPLNHQWPLNYLPWEGVTVKTTRLTTALPGMAGTYVKGTCQMLPGLQK
jgi:hypothetical protein